MVLFSNGNMLSKEVVKVCKEDCPCLDKYHLIVSLLLQTFTDGKTNMTEPIEASELMISILSVSGGNKVFADLLKVRGCLKSINMTGM